jgi:post-segregation antitoxin (ccd killing protein)
MRMATLQRPRKVPTNLSVRGDLVREARALHLNISEIVEKALEEALRVRRREAWLEENRASIDDYNARVAKRGVFSDDWRRF